MTGLSVSAPVAGSIYQQARATYSMALANANLLQAALTANSISASLPLSLLNNLVQIASFAALVGGNATLTSSVLALWTADTPSGVQATVATELNTMSTAAAALASAIVADFPKDGGGHLLGWTFVSQAQTPVTFTASQFPTTATALTAFLAAGV